MNRKEFISRFAGITGVGVLLAGCRHNPSWTAAITGANAATGHMLRNPVIGKIENTVEQKVAIIGGGVSGLSAARALHKAGIRDLVLIDLDEHIGGNAKWGENSIGAYPCGAHYVPAPDISLKEYLEFLRESEVITGFDEQGIPIYDELFVCFDPEERLYINGRWQEGLVPAFGLPADDKKQIERFLAQMNTFRYMKGTDGKDAFAIPVDRSSKDGSLTALDRQTMDQWLQQNGYSSGYLRNYVNYCCRDDYGTTVEQVSAWAGIHYYASRKGKGKNIAYSDVLTWPEGNGFLIKKLAKDLDGVVQTGCLAMDVKLEDDKVHVVYYDTRSKKYNKIIADQCIVAVPQYIASKIIKNEERAQLVNRHLNYVPWMVATLTVKQMEERDGVALSWDNVIYDSRSLGFVDDTHQYTNQFQPEKNLTYYLPLTDGSPAAERKKAREKSAEEWTKIILEDLKKVYPEIDRSVKEVKINIWGHAMAQPLPGLIHGGIREELGRSIGRRIHFANSDLAGVSLFEEAFYQGLNAASVVTNPFNQNTKA